MSEDHRPDLFGHVEATYRTRPPPKEVVAEALAIVCPDCNVNVFVDEDEQIDGLWRLNIAHDETCPWLASHQRDTPGPSF